MKRRVRIREVHDLERVGWILLIFLGLLLAWASRAAALPDNRAWEMVSPVAKNGGRIQNIETEFGVSQASHDGERVIFRSTQSFGEAQSAPVESQYLATREPDGVWGVENIMAPSVAQAYNIAGEGSPYKAFSTELTTGLLLTGEPGKETPLLAQAAPPGYQDYYLRDNLTGTFESVINKDSLPLGENGQPFPASAFLLEFNEATPDLSHVVFSTEAALTPGARFIPGELNLYEWSSEDGLQPINILPGETSGHTSPGATLGAGGQQPNVISTDGSSVAFRYQENGLSGKLYLREGIGTPQTHTIQLDEAHVSGEGNEESDEGVFQIASEDGSRIFFLDRHRLTKDSTASVEPGELYEYNVAASELSDVSADRLANGEPNPADPEGSLVQGVLGASADGSYVYYAATGALPQAEANHAGELPASGQPNVYLLHNGRTRFIATLSNSSFDAHDWNNQLRGKTARVSADGTHLVFMSDRSLTGYDNTPREPLDCGPLNATGQVIRPGPCTEVYVYNADSKELHCVSCDPSGAAPRGSASIPAGTTSNITTSIYQSRVLSDDGERIFFDTPDSLVPQDTNGVEDVYEYEDGHDYLISGGTGNSEASFVDASGSGDDVFFVSGQQLVPGDTDESDDLYDARVNGGAVVPPSPPVCSGTGCQGVPPPQPIFATPSSATFAGEGNLVPAPVAKEPVVKAKKAKPKLKACRKRLVRKRGKCAKRAKAKRSSRVTGRR